MAHVKRNSRYNLEIEEKKVAHGDEASYGVASVLVFVKDDDGSERALRAAAFVASKPQSKSDSGTATCSMG